jgi:hypothetical protein
MTLRISEAAENCSNASSRSRVSSAIFVSAFVLAGLRRPLTLGALERLSVVAFRRRAAIGLPPALERRRIASPKAQDKASYGVKLAQWQWPRVTSSTEGLAGAPPLEWTDRTPAARGRQRVGVCPV